MKLSRDDVLVLKALRHHRYEEISLRNPGAVLDHLADFGLVHRDGDPPSLTPKGADLAAKLERELPPPT
jgi:hypothetical protein